MLLIFRIDKGIKFFNKWGCLVFMRDKPYFELINNTDGFNGITAHCRGGKVLNSLDDVVNELNS